MPWGVKTGALGLLAPLACLCLSASGSDNDRTFTIGPLLGGRDLDVEFSFRPDCYPSGSYCYVDAVGTGLRVGDKGVAQAPISTFEEDSQGKARFQASLSGSQVSAGRSITVIAGISTEEYSRGLDRSKSLVYFQKTLQIKSGISFYHVYEDGAIETQNSVYHFDERYPSLTGIETDSYDIEGLCMGRDLSGRKLPLDELYVDYFGYACPDDRATAELRMLDYGNDFASIGTNRGNYIQIPLKVSIKDMGNHRSRYTFALSRSYYYSRVDLKAYLSMPLGEPYFRSSSFFLPLREKHDDALYRYQVVLYRAGAYGETLILDNKATSSRSYFGNCLSSEYCVVVGGK